MVELLVLDATLDHDGARMLAFLYPWLFCTGAASPADPIETGGVLYVRGEHGYAAIATLDPGLGTVEQLPVPLLARSERVRRAALTNDGVRFRVFAGTRSSLELEGVSLEALRHPVDSQVLINNGEVWIVGPPSLPLSIVRPENEADELTPELARQDVNIVSRCDLAILPPANGLPHSLVLIGDEASSPDLGWSLRMRSGADAAVVTAFLPAGPRHALVLAAPEGAFRLALGDARLDQMFYADARKTEASERRSLAVRSAAISNGRITEVAAWRGEGELWPLVDRTQGAPRDESALLKEHQRLTLAASECLDLAFEPPPTADEGFTWTLLVRVTRTAPSSASSTASSASSTASTASSTASSASVAAHPIPARYEKPAAPALFRDVAREAGVELVHSEGPDLQLDIRPTMGPGAAWGDVDGDGWVDLFLVQGAGRDGSKPPHSKLFKNLGNGRFRDVTRDANLGLHGAGMGALFFDAEGDGDLDLFVANYGTSTLHVNDGPGRFREVGADCLPAEDRWHAAVVAADYDRDGDLDLYVTSYLLYDEASMPPADELGRYQREDPIAMLPFAFHGERKTLLQNQWTRPDAPRATSHGGTLAFVDKTEELGLADGEGRGMQALFWDYDRDGDQDLYLANDVSPNRMWRNEGDGRFKDVSFTAGVDDPRGCMGLAAGDVDGDGDEDLCITNWQLEANALYINNLVTHKSAKSRVATFRDNAVEAGIGGPSVGVTKWGVELADFDLDGDLDLFYANGYTSPDYESTGICVGQPCHYFENDGEGRFTQAFEKAGADALIPLSARAAVACDYDQDGDLDLVVTANNGRVRLLQNTLTRGRHWLGVRLHGKGANPFAIGAEVTVKLGERAMRRSMRAGTSYLCGNAPELHFGLGAIDKVDELIVRWPSGRETRHPVAHTDRFVTIAEP